MTGTWNPFGCGACAHFQACQVAKRVKSDTGYCQYRPSRFEKKESKIVTPKK